MRISYLSKKINIRFSDIYNGLVYRCLKMFWFFLYECIILYFFIDLDFVLLGDEEIKEDDGEEEEENMGKIFNIFFKDFILNYKK